MNKYLVKVNGKEFEVEVIEVKPVSEPATSPAKVVKELVQKPQQSISPIKPAEGTIQVKSPMPGTILKINVVKGDNVKKGDVILVLEAMKMENEIVSPSDGKVILTEVGKGSSVNAGDLLISISIS